MPTQRGVDGYVVLWYVSDERNGAIHNKNKSAIVTVIEPEKYKKVESPRKVYTSLSMPGTQMRENVQINGWKVRARAPAISIAFAYGFAVFLDDVCRGCQ